MKRFIYIILAAALVSCSEEITLDPAVSLFTETPEILEETAIFRLVAANMPDSTERRFPVVWGGDAERGTDYTVSADAFVIGAGATVDSIIVTTLRFGTGRSLEMTVELPEGTGAGYHLKSGYTLQDKLASVSFSRDYMMLTDSIEIGFKLTGPDGNMKAVGRDAEITLSVDTGKSTALEGTDFEFSDSSSFIIRAGEKEGSLKLKSLNPHPQEGRDLVVIDMSYNDMFGQGSLQEIEISLLDTLWKGLEGDWVIDTLVTDSLYMEKIWGDACSGYSLIPEFNAEDNISFNIGSGLFDPSFSSSFKNYFFGNSDFRKGGVVELDVNGEETVSLQTFMLDNTNRFFSAEERSEDKESMIGLRFIEGETSKTDTLDLYLIDHTSKSFMPELEAEGKYAPEKPVAASPGQYLNLTFVKKD